jgi:putative sigma-54 modulation protein
VLVAPLAAPRTTGPESGEHSGGGVPAGRVSFATTSTRQSQEKVIVQIEVTSRGDWVSEAAKTYAREKLAKVGKFFDRVGRIHVSLERSKDEIRAHAVAHLDSGSTLVAETAHAEIRAAIDLLSEKLERQVTKEKERLIGRGRKGAEDDQRRS